MRTSVSRAVIASVVTMLALPAVAQPHPLPGGPALPAGAGATVAQPPPADTRRVAIEAALGVGPTRQEPLDDALAARSMVRDDSVYSGDVALLVRTGFLWVGGRVGMRNRRWLRAGGGGGQATCGDLLALAEARIPLGRSWELAFFGALGLCHMTWSLESGTTAAMLPRVAVGMHVGVSISDDLFVFARTAYEHARWNNVADTTLDVDLSGATFSIGIGARL